MEKYLLFLELFSGSPAPLERVHVFYYTQIAALCNTKFSKRQMQAKRCTISYYHFCTVFFHFGAKYRALYPVSRKKRTFPLVRATIILGILPAIFVKTNKNENPARQGAKSTIPSRRLPVLLIKTPVLPTKCQTS